MSENSLDEPTRIHDLTEQGRRKLEAAQDTACNALTSTTAYIRANPWIAVAGAAVIGGAIAVLSRSHHREPRKFEIVRDWLDDAYAKLPSQKQVQSLAESTGLPDILQQLKKKLHLS